MKNLALIVFCLSASFAANAELAFKEIRTASKDVLVAYFKSTMINADEVNTTNLASWKLNGQPVTAINKFVTEADACDHHIYLQVPTLVNGTTYTLQTPHGEMTFVFDDRTTFLRVHQIESEWLQRPVEGALRQFRHLARRRRDQANQRGPARLYGLQDGRWRGHRSGHVAVDRTRTHRRAISFTGSICRPSPKGGPYKIAVKGYGCSYPFGVGGDFSRRLGHVSFRSLYHQRCGCPIVEPYAWNIKPNPCHTTIYDRSMAPSAKPAWWSRAMNPPSPPTAAITMPVMRTVAPTTWTCRSR